jgi:hypothetical protein
VIRAKRDFGVSFGTLQGMSRKSVDHQPIAVRAILRLLACIMQRRLADVAQITDSA